MNAAAIYDLQNAIACKHRGWQLSNYQLDILHRRARNIRRCGYHFMAAAEMALDPQLNVAEMLRSARRIAKYEGEGSYI